MEFPVPGLRYGLGAGRAERVAGPWADLQPGHMNRINLSFLLFLLFPVNLVFLLEIDYWLK